jgi:hypothetical protein
MKIFQFNTIKDFEEAFQDLETLVDISKETVQGIVKAIDTNKKVADLYKIDIISDPHLYVVRLPKSEWESTLKNCMSYFEKADRVDETIDTFQLIKRLK